jgi:hypothetical protein
MITFFLFSRVEWGLGFPQIKKNANRKAAERNAYNHFFFHLLFAFISLVACREKHSLSYFCLATLLGNNVGCRDLESENTIQITSNQRQPLHNMYYHQ